MIVAVALASVAAFAFAFWKAGVVPAASKAVATASHAGRVMVSRELDDDSKEREVQRAAISLVGSVLSIAMRSLVAVAMAAVPVYGAAATGLVASDAVIAFMSRGDVIVTASVIMIVGHLLQRQGWRAR